MKTAIEKGVTALALTNINNTYDIWPFVKAYEKEGIKPVVGVEIRNKNKLLYILIAANNNGQAWVHQFISHHQMAKLPFPELSASLTHFEEARDGFVIYPFGRKPIDQLLPNEE